jgi:hypothetical protein
MSVPSYYRKCQYIITFFIDKGLSETEQNNITNTIYNMLDGNPIVKNLSGTNITIKWMSTNLTNLQYYTESCEFLSDEGVFEHTTQVVNDIKEIIDITNFSYIITKPISKKLCMI